MNSLRKRFLNFYAILGVVLMLAVGAPSALAQIGPHRTNPYAGAEIVGNPHGATDQLLFAPAANGKVKRVVYFNGVVTPTGGTTTPVVSTAQCGFGDFTIHTGEFVITGTQTGTSPTLTVLWRHSYDGGTTWHNVGTWTQITGTSITTPANTDQVQTVSDITNNSTAVAYGDCWDAVLTFGGTGAVGANVRLVQYAK